MIDSYTLDSDALDRIDADDLIDVLGLDLKRLQGDADVVHVAHWIDDVDQHWELPTAVVRIGTRILMWTNTDEAGVDDVTVVEAEDDIDTQVAAYAEEIASGLGTLADVTSGEHYTKQGVQYQHLADGHFDRDGYRVIVTPRT